MDVKNDRLMITNNVPYGANTERERRTGCEERRCDLYLGSIQQCHRC
jgi:hypothetical protein